MICGSIKRRSETKCDKNYFQKTQVSVFKPLVKRYPASYDHKSKALDLMITIEYISFCIYLYVAAKDLSVFFGQANLAI